MRSSLGREPDDDPLIDCPRVDRPLPLSEHLACPYNFGQPCAIRTGRLETFCDFRKGQDPVQFGDPERLGIGD